MEYQTIKTKDYQIHLINTDKFHSIEMRVFFTENVSKELITYRNVLMDMLTYATKNYPSKRELIRKCQNIYSLYPSAGSTRYGNYLITRFGVSILDSIYIDEKTLVENIELLKEVILNPLVSNEEFDLEILDGIKKDLEIETKTIEEDPRLYANVRALEKMGNGDNYALNGYSDLKILERINPHNLYESYLKMLNESRIDIFLSGNLRDINKISELIKKNFVLNKKEFSLVNPFCYHQYKEKIVQKTVETKHFTQSKLSMGYKIYDLTDYESRYALLIFNSLFGGDVSSLLMQKVRDENSLCYYINSFTNRLDNILFVNSGIDSENKDKVIDLVNEVKRNIEEGKFSENDLFKAKMSYIVDFKSVLENNRGLIDYYFGVELFNSDFFDKRAEMIKNISKEDIMNISKKIKLDTVFVLEGDL